MPLYDIATSMCFAPNTSVCTTVAPLCSALAMSLCLYVSLSLSLSVCLSVCLFASLSRSLSLSPALAVEAQDRLASRYDFSGYGENTLVMWTRNTPVAKYGTLCLLWVEVVGQTSSYPRDVWLYKHKPSVDHLLDGAAGFDYGRARRPAGGVE